MNLRQIFDELRERRVIRAMVIYAALFWAAVQAADLFAEADIIDTALVRWLLIIGAVGFPIVVIASWFAENPWKDRRGVAVAGDVAAIAALAVAAFLFAWQQWFTTIKRPTIAVLAFEATDLNEDTPFLADYLSERLRTLLAAEADLHVIENRSSQHPALADLSLEDTASLLTADILVDGSVARGGDDIRVSVQIHNSKGAVVATEVFNDRLLDLSAVEAAAVRMVMDEAGVADGQASQLAIEACEYPTSADAILSLAGASDVAAHLDAESSGLLFKAAAEQLFAEVSVSPPARRPVLQRLANERLVSARSACPDLFELEALEILSSKQAIEDDTIFERHPNNAALFLRAARGHEADKDLLYHAAHSLDPANPETLCYLAAGEKVQRTFLPEGCK